MVGTRSGSPKRTHDGKLKRTIIGSIKQTLKGTFRKNKLHLTAGGFTRHPDVINRNTYTPLKGHPDVINECTKQATAHDSPKKIQHTRPASTVGHASTASPKRTLEGAVKETAPHNSPKTTLRGLHHQTFDVLVRRKKRKSNCFDTGQEIIWYFD